jgi:ankyrin repeat protein
MSIIKKMFDCCEKGNIKMLSELINKECDELNSILDETNLISIACQFGHIRVVEYLLASYSGIIVNVNNNYSISAIDIAGVFGHNEIVNLIKIYKKNNLDTHKIFLLQ